MNYTTLRQTLVLLVLLMLGIVNISSATPNYGRKYSLPCSGCHTVVPRLNETGFNFRAAGYRMPDEIGKPMQTFNLGDYFSGRMQTTIQNVNSTPVSGPSTSNTAFTNGGMEFFAFNGAFTKNLSMITEVGFAPGNPVGFSGGVKYATGKEDGFFTLRLGILHNYEGYGAADRGIGNGSPLMITTAAANSADGVTKSFTLSGFNQLGLEGGYTMGRSSIRAVLNGGVYYNDKLDPVGLSPSVGGTFTKSKNLPSTNSFDLQIYANQILTEDGGGISGVFYLGQVDLPTGISGTKAVDSLWWTNSFNRWALFASYPVMRGLILAGYESGVDNSFKKATLTKGDDLKSGGFFVGAEYSPIDLVGFGVRYDMFDPAKDLDDNDISQIAIFGNYSFGDGLQLVAQYALKNTKSAAGTQKDNTIRLTVGFIQ